MPITNGPDGSLYYTDQQIGAVTYPPLVLIHGAGGSHLDWPPELRRLPQARLIALDLPGHGRSPGPGYERIEDYAAAVGALLDALAIRRAILVGHSMGGAVAQQLALDRPGCAAGLVLIGTGSKLPIDPTLPQRIVDETPATVDWLVEWAWSDSAPLTARQLARTRLLETPPEVLRGDYLACQAFDVRERLGEIAAPTLVIGASGDRMVKIKFSAFLAEHIPGAELVVIDSNSHMFTLEHAPAVVEALVGWLARQEW